MYFIWFGLYVLFVISNCGCGDCHNSHDCNVRATITCCKLQFKIMMCIILKCCKHWILIHMISHCWPVKLVTFQRFWVSEYIPYAWCHLEFFIFLDALADTITNHQSDGILRSSGNSQGSMSSTECEAVVVNEGCESNSGGFLPVYYDLNNDIHQILERFRVYAKCIHEFSE